MEDLSQTRPHVTPNIVTYSCVMTALSKSKQRGAAQEAQNVLDRMLERYHNGDMRVKPDTVAFSTVIDAWARDDSPHAAQCALDLLDHMVRLSYQGYEDMAPNALTYTSVLAALGRSRERNATDIAEALLEDMYNSSLQPSTIHYNCVLDAHAKSPSWTKAQRAVALLEIMQQRNVPTDIITYNSIMAACANTFGSSQVRRRALQIALDTYKQVVDDATPITYFLLFKALRKLIPAGEERWNLIQKAFAQCCRSGLLSERVLGQVRLGCSLEQYQTLLPRSISNLKQVQQSDLPAEWTRHANMR